MATQVPVSSANSVIKLPQDGPLIGWVRYDGDYVCARLFATVDDSDSLPAMAMLASYKNQNGDWVFLGAPHATYPSNASGNVPYLSYHVLEIRIPVIEFSVGKEVCLEVVSFHTTLGITLAQVLAALDGPADTGPYVGLKDHLTNLLAKRLRTLNDPTPESRSFENRYDRSLSEAVVTLRLPPNTAEEFKFIATTCRYPGFAFESQRVDAASFDIIAREHCDASGMLMLGDQIYADATASLFDNLTTLEKFQERYRAMFRSPGFAQAVRAIPCYMTGDDHEFSESWSVPDSSLKPALHLAAQQSYGIYQLSHSPFAGALDTPPFDYSFICGPVAVYVMDTISNRDTQVPGGEKIVLDAQLNAFATWLADMKTKEFGYVILATGAVVAPGGKLALDAHGHTDPHRAQGFENWQAYNDQRIKLLNIIATSNAKVLLVSGDYHCAAMASIKIKDGKEIAKAVVVPPAYAPMRYANATIGMVAPLEKTGGYVITPTAAQEGSGFAVITIEKNGDWAVAFKTEPVADT